MTNEAERLYEIIESESVRPNVLESGLEQFSDEAKDAVVARIATAAEPPPGRVLARLPLIRTRRNERDMATALLAGLHASDPDARKFGLYGLQELGHPATIDAALAALDDDDDGVVTAASTVLLPKAAQEPAIADALRRAYEARKGNEEFHTSVSLLEARLIEPGTPT
jgi:hypothetical protein